MEDINKIYKHISSFVYPKTNNIYKEEMLAYIFVTNFVNMNQEKILPRLRLLIEKIKLITSDYFKNHKNQDNENIIEVAIAKLLTCDKCRNTGAVDSNPNNINGIIENGNIREIFFILDEFINNGCHVASWLLYCNRIDNISNKYDLSKQNIINKLKFVAEVISGSKQSSFNDNIKLEKFIKTYLGTKYSSYSAKGKIYKNIYPWETGEFPSYCNLWNIQERTYFSHKLLFMIEKQRYSELPETKTPFGFDISDTTTFNPPSICDTYRKNFDMSFKASDIKSPTLSSREISYLKKINRDIELNDIILWKGGCCNFYAKDNTITYKLASDKSKPRTTSYSGHVISNFELLSLLDPEFESWKEIYLVCIMATMIPYCHHTAHEILSVVTYWGIDYDFDLNYFENFNNILKNNKIINNGLTLLNDINNNLDNFFKYKKYKLKYQNLKNNIV